MNTATTSRRPCVGAEVVNVLLGISMVLSPFIFGFSRSVERWNNIAVGIALVLVALLSGWVDEAYAFLVVPVCAWLFFSPFVLGFSSAAFIAFNVPMAFVIIAAGAASEGLREPNA